MLRESLYLVALIFLLISIYMTPVWGDQHRYDIGIDWVRRYKIMPGDDKPYCVAEKGNYIYVSGFGNSGNIIYVFKMSKSSGYVERVWSSRVSGCFAELYDCRFIGDYLYVVGKGCNGIGNDALLLLVFDSNLGLVLRKEEDFTPKSGIFYSLTNDESYLYVVGGVNESDGHNATTVWLWRLEKRRLDSLDLVKSFTLQRFYGERPFKVEVNPVTNNLWVVGADRKGDSFVWVVEIFSRDLVPVKTLDLGLAGRALTMCFDSNGYAYIGGDNAIAKLDPNGAVVGVAEFKNYTFSKSLCIGNMIFLAGDVLGKSQVVLLDDNLTLLAAKILHDPTNATRSGFDIGSMAFDGRNIYAAGYEESKMYEGQLQWVVYKLYITRDGNILLLPVQTPRIAITISFGNPTALSQYSIAIVLVVTLIAISIAVAYLRKKSRRTAKRKQGSRHKGKTKR